jgi:hypothetical protein
MMMANGIQFSAEICQKNENDGQNDSQQASKGN